MFRLIWREIEDRIVYFVIAIILAAAIGGMTFYGMSFWHDPDKKILVAVGFVIPVLTAAVFCGMGAGQIYSDRNKKILAFLSTLAVTRQQMFAAKLFVGTLAIGILFVPVAVMAEIWIAMFLPSMNIYRHVAHDYLLGAFFINLAGYSIGLVTGWNNSKVMPTLGGVFLALLLWNVVIIKGLKPGDLLVVVVPFIISCWMIAWRKFMTASF